MDAQMRLFRSQAFEESENTGTNPSSNVTMGDVIAERFSRRDLMKGILAVPAIAAAASPLALLASEKASAQGANTTPTFNFKEVTAGIDDKHYIAEGYDSDILIRWGDPVLPDAPLFDPTKQTKDSQSKQFGYNNDYLGYIPMPGAANPSEHGFLCVNHEYTNEELMFPGLGRQDDRRGGTTPFAKMTKEIAEVEQMGHGGTVLEVMKTNGKWAVVQGSKYARRITADTEMRFSGPAAGHERLATKADPTGTKVFGMLNTVPAGARRGARGSLARRTSTAISPASSTRSLRKPATTSAWASRAAGTIGATTGTASTLRRSRTRRTASAGSSRSTQPIPTPCRSSALPLDVSSTRVRLGS